MAGPPATPWLVADIGGTDDYEEGAVDADAGCAGRPDAPTIVLAHNHPSGDPTPSPADREMSRRVAAALAAIDMRLLDHVIIARNGWASAGGDISSIHISTGKGCAPRAVGA